MVNQTKQNTIHICKWGSCTGKFDSMSSLWKHVEQQHVDNATPRLIHLVNDDDAPSNTAIAKPSINFATSQINQINQSYNVYPSHINTSVINTVMNGTGNINSGQNMMIPNLNFQGAQQTPQARLQQGTPYAYDSGQLLNTQMAYLSSQKQQPFLLLPASPSYHTIPPNFQQMPPTLPNQAQMQQIQLMIQANQSNVIPLGSMQTNPITIDDNNTMDVDSPVINAHQRLGRPPITQVQKKGVNPNRPPLTQNTKK